MRETTGARDGFSKIPTDGTGDVSILPRLPNAELAHCGAARVGCEVSFPRKKPGKKKENEKLPERLRVNP